ncbi:Mitogen-activated protein kinase MKC1 [Spathaspora sp. JA1]|nr:Mitogen-activated protein kinase MKC1 [Spathaspora sp. JA1]
MSNKIEDTGVAAAPIYYGRTVNKVYNQEFIIDKRFKIVKELGHGAYGIVCSAKYDDGTTNSPADSTNNNSSSSSDGSYVAIKKITNIFSKKILCKRSLRELKLLQFFRGHKNITCLYDLDIIPNPLTGEFNEIYLYEELMECDMHQIIRSGQPLTDSHYQSFIYQVLCGLKYIHSADVLHRDLKPGNLLVNADCELKICDFGLARGFSENPEQNSGFMTEYVATRWYRAPEIMLSFSSYTKAIDIWSVGCILAELLGGKPIFRGKDYVDQLNQILLILGTPPEATLTRIGSHRAQNYVRSLPIMRKVSYKQLFPNANPLALDLLEKMLSLDPSERITVDDALNHPYLEVWHDPRDEPECQVKFDFKSFETVDSIEDMKQLIIEEVKNFRDFVRKPIEEQQQIQLQIQIQQKQKQQQEEEAVRIKRENEAKQAILQQQAREAHLQQQQQQQLLQQQQQFEAMDISQTPAPSNYDYLNSAHNQNPVTTTAIVNTDPSQLTENQYYQIPKPQELNEFSFQNMESVASNIQDPDTIDDQLYQNLTQATPSGNDYMRLEEDLGFGLDGTGIFNSFQ